MADLIDGMRRLSSRLGCEPLVTLISPPIYKSVYRISCIYLDRRAHDSIGTIYIPNYDRPYAELTYDGLFDHKRLKIKLSEDAIIRFRKLLKILRLERLSDDENLGHERRTLWLLEYATNGLYKALLLSPHTHKRPYSDIINGIDGYLGELVREITVS